MGLDPWTPSVKLISVWRHNVHAMVQEVGDVDACKMLDMLSISTSIQQISSISLHGALSLFLYLKASIIFVCFLYHTRTVMSMKQTGTIYCITQMEDAV